MIMEGQEASGREWNQENNRGTDLSQDVPQSAKSTAQSGTLQ